MPTDRWNLAILYKTGLENKTYVGLDQGELADWAGAERYEEVLR